MTALSSNRFNHDNEMPKAIVLLSGGLDSATCAAQAIADGFQVTALSLDYGQRHNRELVAAKAVVQALGISDHRIISVNLAQWGGSSLTDQTMAIPTEGVKPNEIPVYLCAGSQYGFYRDRSFIGRSPISQSHLCRHQRR